MNKRNGLTMHSILTGIILPIAAFTVATKLNYIIVLFQRRGGGGGGVVVFCAFSTLLEPFQLPHFHDKSSLRDR